MGCVSSNLLNHDEDITRLGSSALSHHIVSLTSTTYGLLNLDPPPQTPNLHSPATPPPRLTLASIFEPRSLRPEPKSLRPDPDVINSWELMAGLDADSFRFPQIPKSKPESRDKENSNPNLAKPPNGSVPAAKPTKEIDSPSSVEPPLDRFERVVIYTTSLRGVRSTFEACNAVRAAIEGYGVSICERDVSMDRGFREELRGLMEAIVPPREAIVPPRVFVKGRYVGGAEEVLKMADEGVLGNLLLGLPKRSAGDVCGGCGGVRFLPCFHCNGSCKVVMNQELEKKKKVGESLVLRCCECNENGLVICPLCG